MVRATSGYKLPTKLCLSKAFPTFVIIVHCLTFSFPSSSPHQVPENLGRALTLADLVKQIVTGNPSRTLWHAATDLSKNLMGDDAIALDELQYLESGGAALEEADAALYDGSRLASQRIQWSFSPIKDDRVAQLLDWIQVMSYPLGQLGVGQLCSNRVTLLYITVISS